MLRGGNPSKKIRGFKALGKAVLISILALLYVGCSGIHLFSQKGRPAKGSSGENVANKPPILAMGSKFTYRDTSSSDGKTSKVTMEVKEKKVFERKETYWIEAVGEGADYFNLYDTHLNWVGSFGDGKKIESASPCIQRFKWPLSVGKKWESKFTYTNYSRENKTYSFKTPISIMGYEDVTVPAGTFKTFRIQAGEEMYWYAPSVGWVVKEQLGSYYTRHVLELEEYTIPKAM